MRSVLIVGGGIVGYCTALVLQGLGRSVVLLDDAPSVPPASWGNAGHIAVEQVEPLASPATLRGVPKRLLARDDALSLPLRDVRHWLPFGLRLAAAARPDRFRAGKAALSTLVGAAMPAWERLVEGLRQPDLLIRDGHFVIWDTPDSAARGLRAWQGADTGTTRFRPIDAGERERLTQLLGRAPAGAIRFAGSGHIASHDLLFTALRRHFVERGGVVVPGRAVHLPLTDGKAAVALSDGRVLTADGVVITAGVASKPLLEAIGHKVPMIAERGYHLQSEVGNWPADLPPLVFEDRSLIVTGFRNYLRASSFVEFSHPDSPPDTAKWERLRARIRDLGLPFPLPAQEWVGCRPTLPDYLPAIGRSDRASNLFYGFGHQHLGLTLGPVTGERIAALTVDQGPNLCAFDLRRFGR
jgi:D-amino-acid dehydrogenase